MNNQRKQFMKERKNYEKLLKTKAKLGILSLPEKEQYQSMIHSQRRNKLIEKEKIIGIVTTCCIGIIMAIVHYRGPYILEQNNDANEQLSKQISIQRMQQTTIHKNEIAEKINACIELNGKANEYFNQGVDEYNTDQRVGISHAENITSLYNSQVMAEFKTLAKIFSYKLDKQIDILKHLEGLEENREQLKKEFEEMIKIDKMYQDEIHEILEREGIAYTDTYKE